MLNQIRFAHFNEKNLLISFDCLFTNMANIVNAQNISNEGSNFWLAFPTHDPSGTSLANMNVFVTSRSNSEVTVSCGTYTETKLIPANTIVPFAVPRANSYISSADGNMVLLNKDIHVVTTAGKPNVAVYAHVYANARSAASLILPKEALGQQYFSMNYTQDNGGRNFLTLVASEDNTVVVIEVPGGQDRTISFPKAGDVYEYYADAGADLTGISVKVHGTSKCKTFAAFSGSSSNTISCTGSRDPLLQQLYPINSWGKNYGVVPFQGRRYILRVVAQEDNTRVQINGITVVINKGKFYESPQLTSATIVKADKLISVAQYALTQSCSSTTGGNIQGDPDMVLLNPVEFSIKNITVFSANNFQILEKYVNIFMKTNKTSTFKLNGAVPAGVWTPVALDPAYSYIQISIPKAVESLTLTADEGFNAIACGFGSAESYAYSAGTNLASTQYLTVVNESKQTESPNACVGEKSDFKITVPYSLTKIVWKFDDGTPANTVDNPTYTKRVVNGDTLYDYTSPVSKTFVTAVPLNVVVTGTLEVGQTSCSGNTTNFEFTIQVDPLPTAIPKIVNPIICAGQEITFNDESKTNVDGKAITRWLWDFGDGSVPSPLQKPTHTYTTSGPLTVILTVFTENNCSNTTPLPITINPKAEAAFTRSTNTVCANNEIAFTYVKPADAGVAVKWLWNFDDPASGILNTSNVKDPKHTFIGVGVHNVTLVIETEKGCSSPTPFTLPITVKALPIANFIAPSSCQTSKEVLFDNSSTDFVGSTVALTNYAWDFGDPASGASNKSTDQQGKHTYSINGKYTISLTVTNANGCTNTKTLTDYEILPRATAVIAGNTNTCTNIVNKFEDKSTIETPGKITKWDWSFGDGATSADQNPTHQYTTAGPYIVTLIVTTADGCKSAPKIFDVKVSDIPIAEFDVPNVCFEKATATFTNRSADFNGATNTLTKYEWSFGDPLNRTSYSKDGVFTYLAEGKYTVILKVTNANGCSNEIKHDIIVNSSSPVASFIPVNATICSNKPIVLKNTSSVPGLGRITRLKWYFNGIPQQTDENPSTSPFDYTFTPPIFTGERKDIVVTLQVFTGSDDNSCFNISPPQTITVFQTPIVEFEDVAPICENAGIVQLAARETLALTGTRKYAGVGVSVDGVFNPYIAGPGIHPITYTFQTADGCAAQITRSILVFEAPKISMGQEIFILKGGQKQLDVSVKGGGKLKYQWSPSAGLNFDDILNPIASPAQDTKYTLTVTSDVGGCVDLANVMVNVLPDIIAPNSFTPNGDGINDVWNIKFLDSYPSATIEIFNRSGVRVFFSKRYGIPFDGSYNNEQLPIGTYYYIINPNLGAKRITGNLTIIR